MNFNWRDYLPAFAGPTKTRPKAEIIGGPNNSGTYRNLYGISFNGEKNLGEIGPVTSYFPEYASLRERGHEAYLTNEIVQTIINKFSTWVIGEGLRLQSEPSKVVLKSEGIDLDTKIFNEITEARFHLYSTNNFCDFSGIKNLGMIENTAYKNVKIGGDVLVILRYREGFVKIQLVDGAHVRSPLNYGTERMPKKLDNGNRLMNGIEMDKTGKHIAYWVCTGDKPEGERIECYGNKSGFKTAYLISGLEYRIDNVRSIPAITTVLETLSKIGRYKDAAVANAEEGQKIVFTIEHQEFSTGESPIVKQVAEASGFGPTDNIPVTEDGVALAKTIAATTNKQTYNMPKGSKLVPYSGKGELHFKDFYSINFDLICATISAPPEVMASKYTGSFSAARAAIKDWEHTLNVERANFSFQFLKPIYDYWLHMEILSFKINAPGYLFAYSKSDDMILASYRKARFVGANVPHIDPLKEVNAERKKLGSTFDSVPLTTLEAATSALNGGDSDANLEQCSEEIKDAKKLELIPKPALTVVDQ